MLNDRAGELAQSLRYRWLPRVSSQARQRWNTLANPQADVRFGNACRLGRGFELRMSGPGHFVAGDGVEFRRDFVCEIGTGGRVEIGSGSAFTYGSVIQCSTVVEVGANCAIGRAFVVDGNHRFRDIDVPTWKQGYDFNPVRIGENTSIASFAVVTADVGKGCFVGAGAVVVDPIPDYCVAVGAPARVVEYFGPPELRPAGLEV